MDDSKSRPLDVSTALQDQMRRLRDADADDARRFEAVVSVVKRDPEAAMRWADAALSDSESSFRSDAAYIVGVIGETENTIRIRSRARLRELLQDRDPEVTASAIRGLSKLEDFGARRLVARLAQHQDAQVRIAVAHALPNVGIDDLSISALHMLTRDSIDMVRDAATFSLGELTSVDDDLTRDVLLARVDDMVYEIRSEAIHSLAVRGDERVLPALRRELQDPGASDAIADAAVRMGIRVGGDAR